MIDRLRYLIRRMREAPLSVTIDKIAGRLRPWFWYPMYRFAGRGSATDSMLRSFRAFGIKLREHLVPPDSTSLADGVLAGGFDVLAYGRAEIPAGGGWHADPFVGFEWPREYFARIDYAVAGSRCDVKVPWELSRLQFLPWLAEASLTGRSGEYLERYNAIVDDWLDSNPVAWGVNWSCPMEAAIRAVNLGASAALLGDALEADRQRRVVASLAEHLKFIDRFPETSDVNGNHYLADLMGACFIAALLFGIDSPDSRARIDAFAKEADQQFEKEGSHLERAPIYHRLCLDMLCIVLALDFSRSDGAATSLAQTAERALGFARNLASGHQLPVIGDSDSGQILWFGEHPRSVSTAHSFLAGESSDSPTGQLRWLRAFAGGVGPQFTLRDRPSTDAGLDSGFGYARSGKTVVVMRAGEQGLRGIASHDHDDALSLWVSVAGGDLIVEAGCHSYTLSAEERRRYIVSSAHNVIRPARGERFEPVQGSVFQNVRGAPIPLNVTHDSDTEAPRIEATLASGIFRRCARGVRVSERRVLVLDSWEWDAPQPAMITWPLSPRVRASADGANLVRLTRDDGLEVTMSFHSDSTLELEIGEHQFSPIYGAAETAAAVHVMLADGSSGELKTEFAVVSIPP